MKIEVGEYVRTIKGLITKIIGLDEFIEDDGTTFYETEENPGYNDLCSKEIVRHSKNIIDLIGVGDYVNGKLIHKIEKRPNYYCYLYYGNCKTFVDYEIKTIVTKEQIASIEYEVEE